MATVDEAIDDTIVDIIENPEKVTVLDTIDDPTLNEIDSWITNFSGDMEMINKRYEFEFCLISLYRSQ